jgi:hypothetical protein
MRCTANPGGIGAHWVKNRYILPSEPYTSFFELEQFCRVSKISALSDCIHIFPPTEELPFKITSRIGTIGTISVYIKSINMVQHDD